MKIIENIMLNLIKPTKLSFIINSFIGSSFLLYIYLSDLFKNINIQKEFNINLNNLNILYHNLNQPSIILVITITSIIMMILILIFGYVLSSLTFNTIKVFLKNFLK